MTRKSEIQKEAANFAADNPDWFRDDIEDAFISGAQWADQTMLDKACEWLKDHWMYSPDEIGTEHRDWFIDQFRKAMEE